MVYKVGGIITAKKNHACGGNQWEVTRVGADIKIKCVKCGRSIFISVDEVNRITKSYRDAEGENG